MPDEEAFCVLIRLMEGYNMRGLYTPNMEGLQLRLYQYDQLLYDLLPKVARHLENVIISYHIMNIKIIKTIVV